MKVMANTLTLRDRRTPEDRAVDFSKRDGAIMVATGPINSLGETARSYRVELEKENVEALVDWLMEWLNAQPR